MQESTKLYNVLLQANILFTSFDMETDVDRVLVYLTFYIVECLKKMQKEPSLERAVQSMHSLAREHFSLPGDAGFPRSLNAFCSKPSHSEAEELKKYFTQVSTVLNSLISSTDKHSYLSYFSCAMRPATDLQRRCLTRRCLQREDLPSGGHAGQRRNF